MANPTPVARRTPAGAGTRLSSDLDRHKLGVTLFLVAALVSFLLSIALWFTENRMEGIYVGLWVPSILAAGCFWLSAFGRAS